MKIKLPKFRILVAVIFFLLSLSVFIFLNFYVNKKNHDATALEHQWQLEELRRENVKTLEHFLELKSNERGELDKHFVGSGDVVAFLDLIESLGAQTQAKAEVTLIDIPKDGSGLLIEVKSDGSFSAVYKFLSLLENAPYELEIVSMEMNASGNSETVVPLWNATFRIKLVSFI